jgi:thioredoxin-like negative regulator of GroEL
MAERLLLVLLLGVASVVVYRLWVRYQLKNVAQMPPTDPILAQVRVGIPVIVYFTTPTCIPCRTQQQPALEQLRRDMADAVQILTIDATEQPDVAERWGVMTAPTTFILDKGLQPRHVNYGVADAAKLKQQLQG